MIKNIELFSNKYLLKIFFLISLFGLAWSSFLFKIGVVGLTLLFITGKNWNSKKRTLQSQNLAQIAFILFIIISFSTIYSGAQAEYTKNDILRYVKLLFIWPFIYILRNERIRHLAILSFCLGIFTLMLPTLIDGIFRSTSINDFLIPIRNPAYSSQVSTTGTTNIVYWRNQLVHGIFVSSLCLIALAKFIYENKNKVLFFIIILICIIDIVFLIKARGAMLALVIGICWICIESQKNNLRRFVTICLIALTVIFIYIVVPNVEKRFDSSVTEFINYGADGDINSSVGHRIHYWKISFEMFMNSPILGSGAGGFRNALLMTKDPFFSEGHGHAHNEYITLISQNGLIGFSLFVYLISATFKKSYQIKDRAESAYMRVILLVFLVNCLTDSILYNQIEGWIFVFFVALVASSEKISKTSDIGSIEK